MKNWFKNLFKKDSSKIVVKELDAISYEELDRENVALKKTVAELNGVVQKQQNKIRTKEQSDKELVEEDQVILDLNQQKESIRQSRYVNMFSLKKFFARYFKDAKFRQELKLTTFDRSTELGKFGDICFSPEQGIAILDENDRIILSGNELTQIFQSVGGIGSDIDARRLPMNLDSEGGYVENLLAWKPAVLRELEDGQLEYISARKEPLYKVIQGKDEQIAELYEKLEISEMMNIKYKNKLDELNLNSKLLEQSNDVARNEKTKMMQKVTVIDKSLANLQADLINSQNITVIQSQQIERLESELTTLLSIAEREHVKTEFVSKIQDLQQVLSLAKEGKTFSKTDKESS